MRFGRVTGTVVQVPSEDGDPTPWLELTVLLDAGDAIATVRSEQVPMLVIPDGADPLTWQADQYTQETIANELALQGWEPIGLAADSDVARGAAIGASSPVYIVRQV